MQYTNSFSGQFILIGTVVAQTYHPKVAKGCKCAMITIVDCDVLAKNGHLKNYIIEDGLDAGTLLDQTLGQYGWCEIEVKNALPLAPKNEGWEPEIEALRKTASKIGIAHMVFEAECEKPSTLH